MNEVTSNNDSDGIPDFIAKMKEVRLKELGILTDVLKVKDGNEFAIRLTQNSLKCTAESNLWLEKRMEEDKGFRNLKEIDEIYCCQYVPPPDMPDGIILDKFRKYRNRLGYICAENKPIDFISAEDLKDRVTAIIDKDECMARVEMSLIKIKEDKLK